MKPPNWISWRTVYKDIVGRWLLPVGDKSVYRTCISFNILLYLHAAGKSLASQMKSQNVWAFFDQCVPEGVDHVATRTSESSFGQATSKVSEVSSLFNLMKPSFLSIFPEDCREEGQYSLRKGQLFTELFYTVSHTECLGHCHRRRYTTGYKYKIQQFFSNSRNCSFSVRKCINLSWKQIFQN